VNDTTIAVVAPIPGLKLNGKTSPQKPQNAAQPSKPAKNWKVRLTGVKIHHLHDLWISGFHFQGQAEVGGGFRLDPGQDAEVNPSEVKIESGVLKWGNERLAENLKGELRAKLDQFFSRDLQGWNIFHYVSAEAKLQAQLKEFSFPGNTLAGGSWLEVQTKTGKLQLHLGLKQGTLTPDSAFDLQSSTLSVRVRDQIARGQGDAWGRMETRNQKPVVVLHADLNKFQAQVRSRSEKINPRFPTVSGKNLALEIISHDLRFPEAFQQRQIRLKVPTIQIANLTYLNSFLPRGAGLSLQHGSGDAKAELQVSIPTDPSDRGSLKMNIRRAQAQWGQSLLIGDAVVEGHLNLPPGTKEDFDISGSRVIFSRVSENKVGKPQADSDWWGVAELVSGRLRLDNPIAFSGKVTIHGKDATPILTLFSDRGALPGIVPALFHLNHLAASSRIWVDDQSLRLSEMMATGDHTEIRGWLRQHGSHDLGRCLVDYGPFSAGIAIDDHQVGIKWLFPSRWFRQESRSNGERVPSSLAE